MVYTKRWCCRLRGRSLLGYCTVQKIYVRIEDSDHLGEHIHRYGQNSHGEDSQRVTNLTQKYVHEFTMSSRKIIPRRGVHLLRYQFVLQKYKSQQISTFFRKHYDCRRSWDHLELDNQQLEISIEFICIGWTNSQCVPEVSIYLWAYQVNNKMNPNPLKKKIENVKKL